jgi:hypothetical protein
MSAKLPRYIRLSDCRDLPFPYVDRYTTATQDMALAFFLARGLRYDNHTGVIRDDFLGVIERPVFKDEHTPHSTLEAVLEMEFSRYVVNAAGRLTRGLSLAH